ncbi:DUF2071 domain-containing protein [Stigmatella sp. ncwal1]|uniref:DUF2071 domain-containing protein n=1 Tax=Stigmatella ashevillensis TaxID=2995309 RepID=A0ABT5D9S0_9BACT|nr:DUF2071 domain-containing protein [Stigmatella ashevillena]MDC0710427.1 DUF2071 domain-containing protein [Stigmatella ashevillena]
MDRLAPSLRPDERVVMYQRWRKLLFLHWELPAEVLARALPPGLSLDTHEGRAFIGLVPFTMRGVRPALLPPFPPLSNFHETNVRTYVHREGKDPGVFFFSLDAANGIAVRLARAWYKLPYFYSRMTLTDDAASGWRAYRSERRWPAPVPATFAARGLPEGEAAASTPGTLQHFLMERYFLYTAHAGALLRGQVHHVPYPVRSARVEGLEESLLEAVGFHRPAGAPLVHASEGVDVEVFALKRV